MPQRGHQIDRYALYGEPISTAELRFLHIEPIHLRSGRHDWTIAAHAHSDLHQILFVTAGGGIMTAEAERHEVAPPALLLVPAATVHAFAFLPGTDGHVVTVARERVGEVTKGDPLISECLSAAACHSALPDEVAAGLEAVLASMTREFVWSAPGRGLAIEADLLRLLVAVARIVQERQHVGAGGRDADSGVIDRFRMVIEAEFRTGAGVSHYARRLGLSQDRLLAICQRKLGEPPKALIHRRIMVEAQRRLIYTAMPVAEIGYDLGFRDPAYFSRFFSRRAGCSPAAFRAAAQAGPTDPPRAMNGPLR